MARLKETYLNEIVDGMTKKFGYKNVMEVPKLEKIVINIGLGDTKDNPKALDNAMNDLSIITGQKPIITKANKNNNNNFKYFFIIYTSNLTFIIYYSIIKCAFQPLINKIGGNYDKQRMV